MPVGDIINQDNIALLDFDWTTGTVQATVYKKGTLDVRKLEIAPDDYFLDDIDHIHALNGRPIIGYVVEERGRSFFYSINYEHGEML